jgi:hypothetical protein
MVLTVAFSAFAGPAPQQESMGPLVPHPDNPRYFMNPQGKPVYLTGFHRGWELQDNAWEVNYTFNWEEYLNMLVANRHNVIRMWCVEHTTGCSKNRILAAPMPFKRTGYSEIGMPIFDLYTFNEEYFDRLQSRVLAARKKGIYVIIMLFQGVSVSHKFRNWFGHYLNKANNINGINGDDNGDGKGSEVHSKTKGEIFEIQKRYIQKVIKTVNNLDNVLYEIANEDEYGTKEWQYSLIKFITDEEKNKYPYQHPVGMTYRQGNIGISNLNNELFNSGADWVSPKYKHTKPIEAAREGQVSILDTDHINPKIKDKKWPWKAFCRGHNPIVLERMEECSTNFSGYNRIRKSMEQTRMIADMVNLAAMTPQEPNDKNTKNDPASTGFCLYNKGEEYVVYQEKNGGEVTVKLEGGSGPFTVRWFSPDENKWYAGGTANGNKFTGRPPFSKHAVLHLKKQDGQPLPSISIYRGNTLIPNGGSFTFPNTTPGVPIIRRFKIKNTGTADLEIKNPTNLIRSDNSCFSQISAPKLQVAGGEETIFKIQFQCDIEDTFSARIRIRSNDTYNSPYVFRVSGTVLPPTIPKTTSFQAVADAWVNQLKPTANYGSGKYLRVRSAATGKGNHTYLKFTVSGVSSAIQSVKLQIKTWAYDFPGARIYHLKDSTWNESTINWNNASLAFYTQFALGPLTANTWHEIDVTSMITGNGTYTLGLVAADEPSLRFWSRESSYKPTLIVTYQP